MTFAQNRGGKTQKTLQNDSVHLGDPAVMAIARAMAAASDIGPPNLDSGATSSATSMKSMRDTSSYGHFNEGKQM